MTPTRRGATALVLVAAIVVGIAASRLLDDGAAGPPADPRGAHVVRFAVDSGAVDRRLGQVGVVRPEASRRPPLLVLLHGRTDDVRGPQSMLTGALFAGLERLGRRAPAVLLVNGGESSYFHDRRSGRWARYVLSEAIPAGLERLGADPHRIAVGGMSMGGFGALHLATRRRFCAVGAHSPALWLRAGDTPPGAFDDAADFAGTDPIGAARRGRRPDAPLVWLDVGRDDPFLAATRAFGAAAGERVRVRRGGHGGRYWSRHMAEYLRFYARALTNC